MSKGSQPSGNTTVTQVNPVQQAQQPFLSGGWNQAQNLYNNNPLNYYPGQTLAGFNSYMPQGYGQLGWMGQGPLETIGANAGNTTNNLLNGAASVQNSPSYAGLNQFGYGQAFPEQQLESIGNNMGGLAFNAPGTVENYGNAAQGMGQNAFLGSQNYANAALYNNPADNLLQGTASGQFLGANPYIASEYNAAAQPVVNNYMTATAPQTDSAMEAAGRYGGGALANAQSQNQLNLGTTLGNLGANLYGQDYANERNLMTQAQGTLGNLALGQVSTAGNLANQGYNSAIGADVSAGNLANSGLQTALQAYNSQANTAAQEGQLRENALNSMQSGFQSGNQDLIQSLFATPTAQNALLTGPQAQVEAGQGLTGMNQAQIQDQMNRYYGQEQAPWQTLSQELSAFGQPTGGSSMTTTPYFTNPMANVLGAGLGGLGLYNGLTQAGLFGGGAGAAGAGMGDFAAGVGSAMPDIASGAAVGADTGAAGKGLASMLPFFGA